MVFGRRLTRLLSVLAVSLTSFQKKIAFELYPIFFGFFNFFFNFAKPLSYNLHMNGITVSVHRSRVTNHFSQCLRTKHELMATTLFPFHFVYLTQCHADLICIYVLLVWTLFSNMKGSRYFLHLYFVERVLCQRLLSYTHNFDNFL